MSIRAIDAVFRFVQEGGAAEYRLRSADVLVLLAMADYADDAGALWGSTATFASKCAMSRRTAIRRIVGLTDKGLVQADRRHRDDGSFASNGYRLTARIMAGVVTKCHKGVTKRHKGGDRALSQAGGDKMSQDDPVTYEPSPQPPGGGDARDLKTEARLRALGVVKQNVARIVAKVPAAVIEAKCAAFEAARANGRRLRAGFLYDVLMNGGEIDAGEPPAPARAEPPYHEYRCDNPACGFVFVTTLEPGVFPSCPKCRHRKTTHVGERPVAGESAEDAGGA